MADRDQGTLEKRLNSPFDNLKRAVGKKVTVSHVLYGSLRSDDGILKNVEDYGGIKIQISNGGICGIPFIGYGCAIREVISQEEGDVLYENQKIPFNYDAREPEKIEEWVKLVFGESIANKMKEKRIKIERDYAERQKKLDELAKTKTSDYIEQGRTLVRNDEDVLKRWEEHVKINTQNHYSASAIEAALKAMRALSEGKPPEEVIERLGKENDLSLYLAGCVANTVSYFHPRGEEFRKCWNEQYIDNKEDAKRIKGVINPAILEIKVP